MQKNIKLIISYDGSRYLGWQRLGNENRERSIQGCIESRIEKILGYSVALIGSGRTDRGVHALGQVANFHVPSSFFSNYTLEKFVRICNEQLPEDIKILSASNVPPSFHSRYSAIKKTYTYSIDTREVPSVFSRKYSLWVPDRLDIRIMKRCAELLVGRHDFSAFSTQTKKEKDTVRTIESLCVEQKKDKLLISVCGDGFLYNMVRILVGTLLEAGKGKYSTDTLQRALDTGDRQLAGPTASSVGLFLKEVVYPLDR